MFVNMMNENKKTINSGSNSWVFAMQQVIKKLRYDNLNEGYCFMIFDDELPENQAYYEYPDGRIQIEQIDKNNLDVPRVVIRTLTHKEIDAVKEKNEVFR
jgi:hypothetical protein